jgi:hypothetical protein
MMKTNLLMAASTLSDQELLARVRTLASREREATAELVAHLAELDTRPSSYAAEGHGSLFRYCTDALGLSEDAAYNRIEAARACRRVPAILNVLASGAVTLTAVRMLARHLTAENHEALLAEATGKSKRQVEEMVARLAARADVPASVRKLPMVARAAVVPEVVTTTPVQGPPPVAVAQAPPSRPVVQATAPERYRVQFTVDRETHDRLRHLQDLMRREIPTGDVAALLRCAERSFLEWHHVWPHARGGPGTVDNIWLRCRRHNVYEAALEFGPWRLHTGRSCEAPSGTEDGMQAGSRPTTPS